MLNKTKIKVFKFIYTFHYLIMRVRIQNGLELSQGHKRTYCGTGFTDARITKGITVAIERM